MKSKLKRIFLICLVSAAALLVAFVIYFIIAVSISEPEIKDRSSLLLKRIVTPDSLYICGAGRLQKSESGIWELYLEGEPFERGVICGKLCKELIVFQEQAFVGQIQKLIPSRFYLNFLKYFVGWFGRDIDYYVNDEFKKEIFGISFSAANDFDFIGPAYQRMLNYHAAHDIGHALQNMNLVGCTSFGAWGNKTDDGSLIIGRNFDFYAGDEFSKNKIVAFYKPTDGFKFMFVTWGGMIGVVSGMNERGLTVTINADKSEIPFSAKTPVSIIAREILQYAGNI
ncbi:MAG: Peptidase, partial [Bacteroidota bacterium]|nr:Peptidase [Bacteroidota bacterium]